MCEPIMMDLLALSLLWRGPTFKCLSAERSLCLNVETEPSIQWCGGGDPHINVKVQKGYHTWMLKLNPGCSQGDPCINV